MASVGTAVGTSAAVGVAPSTVPPAHHTDLPSIIPGSINVVFPAIGLGQPQYVINVQLASLNLPSINQFYSVNKTAVVNLQSPVRAILGSPPVNLADLTGLAAQIAIDWYSWQLAAKLDIVFAGLCPWTPEGGSDYIEWIDGLGTDGLPMVSTRVQRGFFYTYLNNTVESGGSPLTVTDGSLTFPGTTILQFPAGTLSQPGGFGTAVIYTPDGEHDINRWKQAGGWYTSNNSGGISPGVSITADTLYAIPVICTGTRLITGLRFYQVSGQGAGNLAALALYRIGNDAAILPTTLLASALNLDLTATDGTLVSAVISVNIIPGHYWLAFIANCSLGIFGVNGIVPTLPTIADPPRQPAFLVDVVDYTYAGIAAGDFPANPFSLPGNGSLNAAPGPYLAWKFT